MFTERRVGSDGEFRDGVFVILDRDVGKRDSGFMEECLADVLQPFTVEMNLDFRTTLAAPEAYMP